MKKEKEQKDTNEVDAYSDTLASIMKNYGDVIINGQKIVDNPHDVISLSPSLDIILGGGIQKGNLVGLSGHNKVGKTVTALVLAKNCQKKGMKVFYYNIEGRLKPRDLQGIQGLQVDLVDVIGSKPEKILKAEDYLSICEQFINSCPNSIHILDSISQLCSATQFNADIGEKKVAPEAILIAQFLRRIANVLPVNNCILVTIAHLIANIGPGGVGYTESGGRKIGYAIDVKLRAKEMQRWKVGGQDSEPIGQIVTWETQSTSGNIGPGRKIESYIRYGVGIDEITEWINLGINCGFIEQKAAWYIMKFLPSEDKLQGQEKVYQFLLENKEALILLEGKIKELLK